MQELIATALPLAEISIIKRDFDLLRKLIPNLTNDVQTQMIPYTALFCYEAMAYLKKTRPFYRYKTNKQILHKGHQAKSKIL